MKLKTNFLFAVALASGLGWSTADAATRTKADNTDDLILGTSWSAGVVPTSADTAQFDSTLTTPLVAALGADTNWTRITLANDLAVDVTLNGANKLGLSDQNTPISFGSGTATLTVNCDLGINTTTFPAPPTGRTATYNGTISGVNNTCFFRNNQGTVQLAGTNTTRIGSAMRMESNGPKVGIGASSIGDPIASGPLGTNQLQWNGSGGEIFAYNGDHTLGNSLQILNGPMIVTGSNSLTFSGTVDFSGGDREVRVAGTGALRFTGTFISTASLVKSGPGNLELGGTTTANFNNGIKLNGGVLKLLTDDYIPDGSGKGSVTLTNDAVVFDLNGHSDTINGLAVAGGSPSASFVDNTATNTTSTLTVGAGNAISTFSGTIQNTGTGAKLNLVKIGTGTFTLGNANTYIGTTTINAGTLTLNASGTIANSPLITMASNSTFNVTALGGFTLGASQTLVGSGTVSGVTSIDGKIVPAGSNTVGLITFGSALTLNGTAVLDINKDNTPTADKIKGNSTVALGGTLVVVNSSTTPLASGDTFDLFDGTLSGGFANVVLPTLDSGLSWNTANLAVNGTVAVEGVGSTPHPVIGGVTMPDASNFVISGTGGTSGGSFSVLGSTNPTAPRSSWTLEASGSFGGSGEFTVTVPVNPADGHKYYVISVP